MLLGDPLVSVIMPTYHQTQYLPTAILGVVAQTHSLVELIIVSVKDDQETSSVLSINQPPQHTEPSSSLYIPQSLGLTGADFVHIVSEKADHIYQINLGVKAAKGKFLVFYGSDDFMLPNKIEQELSAGKAADAVLVYSRFFFCDEHLNIQAIPPTPPFSYQRLVRGNFIVDSCLVAKSMFDEFGLLEESLGSLAVYDKWLHIAEQYEDRIVFNRPPVILYRTHPEQKHAERLRDPHQIELYERVVKASLARKGLPTDRVKFGLTTNEVERV